MKNQSQKKQHEFNMDTSMFSDIDFCKDESTRSELKGFASIMRKNGIGDEFINVSTCRAIETMGRALIKVKVDNDKTAEVSKSQETENRVAPLVKSLITENIQDLMDIAMSEIGDNPSKSLRIGSFKGNTHNLAFNATIRHKSPDNEVRDRRIKGKRTLDKKGSDIFKTESGIMNMMRTKAGDKERKTHSFPDKVKVTYDDKKYVITTSCSLIKRTSKDDEIELTGNGEKAGIVLTSS